MFWYYNATGRITLRYLIFMDMVCLITPSVSLIFKVFVFKNVYYLELLLLDQTSEQLLIWNIRRGPRVDCGSWIFVVVVVVVITVGSSSPIWRVKSITLVHILHCSLRFQFTFSYMYSREYTFLGLFWERQNTEERFSVYIFGTGV